MITRKPGKVHIGSISTGTLRTENLLEAFADELKYLQPGNTLAAEAVQLLETDECMDATELLDDITSALENLAPPFTYFGALEGDGADFGFWPDHDGIREAIEEAKADYKVAFFPFGNPADGDYYVPSAGVFITLSDHGNITVLDSHRNELWSCV